VIGVDTNILVYAHRRDSSWHAPAQAALRRLAEGATPWVIPYHCLVEFYAVATHPRIYAPASTPEQAVSQIRAWLESPSLSIAYSDLSSADRLLALSVSANLKGAQIHDGRVVVDALCAGVQTFWSADRDLSKFSEMAVFNPLRQ